MLVEHANILRVLDQVLVDSLHTAPRDVQIQVSGHNRVWFSNSDAHRARYNDFIVSHDIEKVTGKSPSSDDRMDTTLDLDPHQDIIIPGTESQARKRQDGAVCKDPSLNFNGAGHPISH
jgi:hypothetical protein